MRQAQVGHGLLPFVLALLTAACGGPDTTVVQNLAADVGAAADADLNADAVETAGGQSDALHDVAVAPDGASDAPGADLQDADAPDAVDQDAEAGVDADDTVATDAVDAVDVPPSDDAFDAAAGSDVLDDTSELDVDVAAEPDGFTDVTESPDGDDAGELDAQADLGAAFDAEIALDVASAATCATDQDCPADAPFCDAAGKCAICVFDAQCGVAGAVCSDGLCAAPKPCTTNSNCTSKGMVCDTQLGVCRPCLASADCSGNQVCWHNQCVAALTPCQSSKECPGSSICSKGACVPCGTDTDCAPSAWCAVDLCVPDVCAPGNSQCTDNASAQICLSNGSGWKFGSCPAETVCTGGSCKPIICQPFGVGCDNNSAWACSGTGTSKISVPCAPGHICVDGGCPLKVCEPSSQSCAGVQVVVCNAQGTSQTLSVCPDNSGCVAGACAPWVCTPGLDSCVGGVVKPCTVSGQFGAPLADCTSLGQVCYGGKCLNPLCVVGEKMCKDANNAATCNADSVTWSAQPCGFGTACFLGVCAPIVCAANQSVCDGSILNTCDATGTFVAAAQDCTTTNTACITGACVPIVCKPGATQCDGAQLSTCNAQGTAWTTAACANTQICDAGACAAIICSQGDVKCSGNSIQTCSDLGTVFTTTTDCTATGQYCVQGACLAQVCNPAETKCTGLVFSTCAADGLSWTNKDCNDANVCTLDSCDAVKGCATVNNPCDDGNVCTTDGCAANACSHVNNSLACNDGNACTTGETCVSGACVLSNGALAVATIAGTGTAGWTDGAGSSAKLNNPAGLARAPDGSFVFVETAGQRVRSVAADGTITTLAGTGVAGSKDGAAILATFNAPTGVAVGADGVVYVADTGNHRIRKIANGQVTTFAGAGAGFVNGFGTAAQFTSPADIAITRGGVLYVADSGNNRIRRIAPSGKVTTAAGTNTAGYVDGAASAAQLNNPCALATAGDGTVYFYDCNNGRVRKLTTAGTVSTVAGAGIGYQDGAGSSALFGKPLAMTLFGTTLLLSDSTANRVRQIDAFGTVSTLAGASAAFQDGAPATARFSAPRGIVMDAFGVAWLADGGNQRIRQLSFTSVQCDDGNPCTTDSCSGGTCTFSKAQLATVCDDGSACTTGDACDAGGKCAGVASACDDGKQCTTDLCAPFDGICDSTNRTGSCDDGLLCTTADSCNGGVCANATSAVSSLAGSNTTGAIDDVGTSAQFGYATGVTTDVSGNLWIVDSTNHRIRKSTPDGSVSTVTGYDANYVDGDLLLARFNAPSRLAFNAAGTAFITDTGNNRIRKIVGSKVSNFAGSGTAGWLDGAATSAQFKSPLGIALDSAGLVYIADRGNFRVRSIASNGTVSTFAGTATQGSTDGAIASATFYDPRGLCIDASNGTMYVADGDGYTLRKIVGGQVTTLAGKANTFGLTDGQGANARFNRLIDCVVDANHDIWVTDGFNFRLRKVTVGGYVTTIAGATMPPVSAGDPGAQTIVNSTLTASVFMHPGGLAMPKAGLFYIADQGAIRKVMVAAPLCDDFQPCTTDSCDATTGLCTHVNLADTTVCTNSVPCTVSESCLVGVCQGGVPKNCDDSNVCTTDACTVATGVCTHASLSGTACTDGNVCTPNDICNAGTCDAGQVSLTTIAGPTGVVTNGFVDAKGTAARFFAASALAWDVTGTAWIADMSNNRIRTLFADGTVSTAAGTGIAGYLDGSALSAKFSSPADIVRDGAGGYLIADANNNRIRRLSGGIVSTVAGSGTAGYLDGVSSSAQFSLPGSVDVDSSGVTYVADGGNHRIRTIALDGTVGTLAGSGTSGGADGAASSASFANPSCVRVTASGALWVVDFSASTVRRVFQDSVVTLAGLYNTTGTADGTGSGARFDRPTGCAIDKSGNLLVADTFGFRIRKVTPAGVVTTLLGASATAGTGAAQTPLDGLGLAAKVAYPIGVSQGPDGNIWIADAIAIRKLVLPLPNCDDGNACTADACNAATGACVNLAMADTTACDDSDACTTGEQCQSGVCGGGSAKNCKDTNACTIDACDSWLGCTHITQPASVCNDNNACTTDACDAAAGCTHTPLAASVCNDSNVCTTDACDPALGCTHTPGALGSCDDGNACTNDACDATLGCTHTNTCCTPVTGTNWGFEGNTLAPLIGGTGWNATYSYYHAGNYGAYVSSLISLTSNLTLPAQAIPVNVTTKLNFWYNQEYGASYALSSGYRTFSVVINGSTIWSASGVSPSTWYSQTIDLTPYAGTTPTIAIRMSVTSGYGSSTYGIDMAVDDIQINTTCP